MPLVSIVVPVYNVERYIERCIASLQQQTLSDIEIIVVNDCTPDNSMEIVKNMARDDQRVQILNSEVNLGPMIAREKGYMAATGEYITFCDSDDSLPPIAIEKLYHVAVESDADIVCGNYFYFNTKGEKVRHNNELRYGCYKIDVLKSLLRHEMAKSLWGKLFKASLLQNYEYHTYEHATNGEDGCLLYQVVANMNKTIMINDIVYNYMQNPSSSTQRRFNDTAINSICISNKTMHDIVSSYPELYTDLNRCITNKLCGLYIMGYNKNTDLSKHISENGLNHYISFKNIVMYLYPFQIIKGIIRYRILNYIK